MSDTELDKEELQEELGQIKDAMGLHERYPYWSRWWLIEGVGVGILFPLIQLLVRGTLPLVWFLVLAGGVFITHQVALRRVIARYERPATGVPNWMNWQYIAFAGIIALGIALLPVIEALDEVFTLYYAFVAGGSILGVTYLFVGQLLEAYHIRKSDRYAFYVGGLWLLVLTAVLPNLPTIREWAFAALGIGLAIHHIGSYLYISRT
jgi:hypothetical protein